MAVRTPVCSPPTSSIRPTARPCCTSAMTPCPWTCSTTSLPTASKRSRPFRAYLRVQARRVRQVLRLVAGHQQAGGCRRGRWHRRRPVHRRAWYPADAAFLPLRWRGFAASDITQGLPRVTELFEARTPKGEAPIAEFAGVVKMWRTERGRQVILKPDDDSVEPIAYPVTRRAPMMVKDGDHVEAGTQLIEGSVDPQEDPAHPRPACCPGEHCGGSAHRVPLPGRGYPR